MKLSVFFFLFLAISACTSDYSSSAINPIRKVDSVQRLSDTVTAPFVKYPTPDNYSICYGHSCAHFASISLNENQWNSIISLFKGISLPSQEREAIKQAIALFEQYSGKQAETSQDRAKNNMSGGTKGQLDCIDEATNTTVYLRLLANEHLLLFHQQASRTSRGGLIAPHNTATITETESKQRYAIDSWFEENGERPYILPLNIWKQGWEPEII